MNRREKNRRIFEDTMELCCGNEILRAAVMASVQRQQVIYEGEKVLSASGRRYEGEAQVIVSSRRSFEAAFGYRDKKVCIHNFASATNPGGGVVRGASAQEESLCRCSTLYPVISERNCMVHFHQRHREMLKTGELTALYNDDCIYSPGIVVFKSDTDQPTPLPEEQWQQVDVITAAAPNLREKPSNRMNPGSGNQKAVISREELKMLHRKRMSRILEIARENQAEVVILGAFGCGAFQNPPEVVADAMAEVICRYRHDFETIELAVYCGPQGSRNYKVFEERFKTL